ncbi:MAG: cytochrome c oxidase subunit 3 family protein [Acidobacteriales bacterium]|nr:MAG: cytochrome c oxidase subunit 3 family protein [Terriglobales bacterium]
MSEGVSPVHNPFLQHHFTEMEQQVETGKLGMWLFLVTELLLFGGLFAGYALMAGKHPEAFRAAHEHLNRGLGALNTVVLLVSSFTMVMAVASARENRRRRLIGFLILTLLLAGVFLGVKYFEYSHKFHEGLLPGKYYSHPGDAVAGQFMFFSFYFMMTGLHGIHIVAGMGVMGWLLWRAMKGQFSSSYYAPVDLAGLYWHLVDIIWIYLFPLLYLIG